MSMSTRERVAKGMEQVRGALIPFVEREMRAKLGDKGFEQAIASLEVKRAKDGSGLHWDNPALFRCFFDFWQDVFKAQLSQTEKNYIGELRDIRNRWAHDEPFGNREADRALDTMALLLSAIGAREAADAVDHLKVELNREVLAEQDQGKTRWQLTLEGMPKAGCKPWRDIAEPHPDVRMGRYVEAEFAADLAKVHRGSAGEEYRIPAEFYRRTYLTDGLTDLLELGLRRLSGQGGGEPVIELQTNFGGGKTHSMLALYHLFGGTPSSELNGISTILGKVGLESAPKANRAVIVGNDLTPGVVQTKEGGTQIRTMWGELAWQLGYSAKGAKGGAEAYAFVKAADEAGTSPAQGDLEALFKHFEPCLILIDEWVAYARQLVGRDDICSGSFDVHATFAQALTEAAKGAPRTLLVVSIPMSQHEVGGENGRLALDVLKNVVERIARPWRPADLDESFEIVRRRLFLPIEGEDKQGWRDNVIAAYLKAYKEADKDFPPDCREASYRDKMIAAYPIHPELLKRLYDDWSSIDKFQRTRGVLRLMAKTIHRLWSSSDQGLLVMPCHVPLDDSTVRSEATRYLDPIWDPIISQDVDGPDSLPVRIDGEQTNLGRLSAARRVARTLYVGTAPGSNQKNPGVDLARVRLGCAQPGETAAAFVDALMRLVQHGRYIHQDTGRYWISTKPNLNQIAQGLHDEFLNQTELVSDEIRKLLQAQQRDRGVFDGVHPAPTSTSEVDNEGGIRLVVFGQEAPHLAAKTGKADGTSPAIRKAIEFLDRRGSGPRLRRNTLLFLAPDQRDLKSLEDAIAWELAWGQILKNSGEGGYNLDPSQLAQAKSRHGEQVSTVAARLDVTFVHLLVPTQANPAAPVTWDVHKLTGTGSLYRRASDRAVKEEAIMNKLGGGRLRMALDDCEWGHENHVAVGTLESWCLDYLYLPRIQDSQVLKSAVEHGIDRLELSQTFAIAETYDADTDTYKGVYLGSGNLPVVSLKTLVVKTEIARAKAFVPAPLPPATPVATAVSEPSSILTGSVRPMQMPLSSPAPTTTNGLKCRFAGSFTADPLRVTRDAGQVQDEIIKHLTGLRGAKVSVRFELEVEVPEGIPEEVVRIVGENAKQLKFQIQEFE